MDPVQLISPELARSVSAITDNARRREIARRAVREISVRIGVAERPEILTVIRSEGSTFSPTEREQVAELVERWDEAGWAAQEAGDEAAYDREFRAARAASAVSNFVAASPDGNLADVLYETFIASGRDLDLIRSIVSHQN